MVGFPQHPPFLSSFLRTLFPAHQPAWARTLLATGTSKQRTSERVSSHEARIEGAIDLHPVDNGRTEDDDKKKTVPGKEWYQNCIAYNYKVS